MSEASSEETQQLLKRLMLTIEAAQDANRRAEKAVAMAEAILRLPRVAQPDLFASAEVTLTNR